MTIILVMIMIVFQIITNGLLMKPLNITNIFLQNSYILVLAIGMLVLIVLNHTDLSVGSIVAVVGALAGTLMVRMNVPIIPAILICLLAGSLIGAFQGFWVAIVGVPSFIVTLSGQLLYRGITMVILQGKTIAPLPSNFQIFSTKFVPEFLPEIAGLKANPLIFGLVGVIVLFVLQFRSRAKKISYGIDVESKARFIPKLIALSAIIMGFSYILANYKGVPIIITILLALALIYHFIMSHTKLGRHIYAIGGNMKAATLSGIKAKKITILAFTNMGLLAAVSGLIFVSRLNASTPQAGTGFELDAIAACYIGGASASGGIGKIMGSIVGGLVMAVLNNGMSLMGVGSDVQQAIKGAVLLLAVALDVINRKRAH
ncbi:ABC transporter permease [Erysipelothrix larvae]|uniref:Xylose transport system permease protein XylH n=2 Tax=Erysipelothrix larvae TaxID=1514105 RepID=A0A0X8H2J5_9FIRM|nr:ABC transporter permease [Erysipelothrix larvae]